MPARSKAQQRLFGMALAVRRGEMKRSEANQDVLDIADSDMTNKDIEDFAKTDHKGLPERKKTLKEALETAISQGSCKNPQFVVIKPGFLKNYNGIMTMIEDEGYEVIKEKAKKLTLDEAHRMYEVHKKEDFYEDLCKYMSSGMSTGLILLPPKDDSSAYDRMSKLKDKIRDKYGEDEMHNAIHSSDSKENMLHESAVYF